MKGVGSAAVDTTRSSSCTELRKPQQEQSPWKNLSSAFICTSEAACPSPSPDGSAAPGVTSRGRAGPPRPGTWLDRSWLGRKGNRGTQFQGSAGETGSRAECDPLQRSWSDGSVEGTSPVSLPHSSPHQPPSVTGDKCGASSGLAPSSWTGEMPVLCSLSPKTGVSMALNLTWEISSFVKSTPVAFWAISEKLG